MYYKLSILLVFVFQRGFADAGECGVVSKKEWGGLNPLQVEYLPRPVDLVIIQHTTTNICDTDVACAGTVRNLQSYHMEFRNYSDIAHSFLVGGNGKIYEGTGWLHMGSHTEFFNNMAIGVCFIGNFDEEDPKPEALNATKALLKCGVERGHLKSNYHVVAHSQLKAVQSPGEKLYNEIRKWPEWSSLRLYTPT